MCSKFELLLVDLLLFLLALARQTAFIANLLLVAASALDGAHATANCGSFANNEEACAAAISDTNQLFCQFFTSSGVCVPRLPCTECFSPVAGVCTADCTAGSSFACADSQRECASTNCDGYLAGWNGNSCLRYAAGGRCSIDGGCVTASSVDGFASGSDTAALDVVCAGIAPTVVATCGSAGCRQDTCTRGASALASATHCFTFGQRGCPNGQKCDATGTCVDSSICDYIDRLSDCGLVTFPGNNRPCARGTHQCDTPTASTAAAPAPQQAGCSSLASKGACESSTCSRNQGTCIWVDFKPGSPSSGVCACPADCPDCATMVNGRCEYDCSNPTGCTLRTCDSFSATLGTCANPTTTTVLGRDPGTSECVCRVHRVVDGCGQGETCDIAGNCATTRAMAWQRRATAKWLRARGTRHY